MAVNFFICVVLCISIAFAYSYRIVKPLRALTQYVEQINQNLKS